MLWQDNLKHAGVSIHIIATGGGAGIVQQLWEVPGSSAYLSGFSFPYAQEEQTELLGFNPGHFCSEEAAVDLASAAYMKAYRLDGKSPVGVGLTASVASEKEHRGDHRVHCCIITDHLVRTHQYTLMKGKGELQRQLDGGSCDDIVFYMLCDALGLHHTAFFPTANDATQLATRRFLMRPFFDATGKREHYLFNDKHLALMPGAFNPPHKGHFGVANSFRNDYAMEAVFEVTAVSPHKDPLTVQDMLKRAKLLQGHHRFFSTTIPMYIDKARAYSGMPLIMGADAAMRLLDPTWGPDVLETLKEFQTLETKLYISGREINGKFTTRDDIAKQIIFLDQRALFLEISRSIEGEWDISSTQLRNK
jgi:hypothetical protein